MRGWQGWRYAAWRRALAAVLCAIALGGGAGAHERSESVSHWVYTPDELRGVISIRSREITRLMLPGESDDEAALTGIFLAHVARSVRAAVDGVACIAEPAPRALDAEPGYVRIEVRETCRPGKELTLDIGVLVDVAPSHHHFIFVEALDGERVVAARESILSVASTQFALDVSGTAPGTPPSVLAGFWPFVATGIVHIATGVDHLAFLLALLVGARTVRQTLLIITGFTVGHSLTLSAAVLGIVQANRTAVEASIGLTIALTAALNLVRGEREGRWAAAAAIAIIGSLLCVPRGFRPDMPPLLLAALALSSAAALWLGGQPARSESALPRVGLAAGFGLVHGLGFASALQDLQLPPTRLVATLLGFNLGVEVGQLAAVAIGWVCAAGAMRMLREPGWTREGHIALSAGLLALGIVWFLTRAVSGA